MPAAGDHERSAPELRRPKRRPGPLFYAGLRVHEGAEGGAVLPGVGGPGGGGGAAAGEVQGPARRRERAVPRGARGGGSSRRGRARGQRLGRGQGREAAAGAGAPPLAQARGGRGAPLRSLQQPGHVFGSAAAADFAAAAPPVQRRAAPGLRATRQRLRRRPRLQGQGPAGLPRCNAGLGKKGKGLLPGPPRGLKQLCRWPAWRPRGAASSGPLRRPRSST
ncbi:hypothetical protein ETH_00030375 [Eimeria tenella]|uniref:Uncharacterized protein n=1 Tax=Eimeria tenella TaxID=5802 RepID=U6KJB6_EIMTE|nr:hypothetical protein ETH_00030375 [Eimeria tenella]CDJ38029.1 hypothetical protein ETH_00030375 [Eimeria tenella]|eukprot:XP_013228867.1 hypothetical protein ETH_00030375 [Eimeria tenella]